jgi:hypothetical protein
MSDGSALGNVVEYSVNDAKTRLDIRTSDGQHHPLAVQRDATVLPSSKPRRVEVVVELARAAVVLIDTYASKRAGLSSCQAGEEKFLRIISIEKATPVQTQVIKMASCRDNIELADPGIEWDAGSRTLTIHWLSGPTHQGVPEQRTIRLLPEAHSR